MFGATTQTQRSALLFSAVNNGDVNEEGTRKSKSAATGIKLMDVLMPSCCCSHNNSKAKPCLLRRLFSPFLDALSALAVCHLPATILFILLLTHCQDIIQLQDSFPTAVYTK